MEIIDIDNNQVDPCYLTKPRAAWSHVGVICNNDIYGNYVVASRLISKGELLLEELPLSVASYGRNDLLPYCLTCGKDVALSERCGKCRWPMCNNGRCENDSVHASECEIFVVNNVRPKNLTSSHYGAIEVLRGLLLRSKDPAKWNRIIGFEAHLSSRTQSTIDSKDTEFIMDFLFRRCGLTEFDRTIVDRVIGVYSVNTFWALRDTGRYISLLFDQVTLLAHDCNPNTGREIIEKEVISAGTVKKTMCMKIIADRTIFPGEIITTYYTSLGDTVAERRKYLQECFFFECLCERCVRELKEEEVLDGNNNPGTIQ